jgi:hypothetical protein
MSSLSTHANPRDSQYLGLNRHSTKREERGKGANSNAGNYWHSNKIHKARPRSLFKILVSLLGQQSPIESAQL